MKQKRKRLSFTACYLMSWYFTAGLHLFPLITEQMSNYYAFFQTCMPNWWWHFIQMIEVRGKVIQKSDDWEPLTILFPPSMSPTSLLPTHTHWQNHCVWLCLHFKIRGFFWTAGQGIAINCQILGSSWGRKWELQQRTRKIWFCMNYNASGKLSWKYNILTSYWLIFSLDSGN